jgi:predicted ArsR family transcriptional regulator
MIGEAAMQCRDLYAALVKHGPLTADEADDKLGWRESRASGRRMSDLVKAGLAEFTGETRKTRSGRQANVYRACVAQQKGAA